MINIIILKLRGINTQDFVERLKILRKMHQISNIAILEPFVEIHITCDIKHNGLLNQFTITFVYEKFKDHLTKTMWDKMLQQSVENYKSLCVVDDCNFINDIDKKLGHVPHYMIRSMEFICVIEACGLLDIGFNGQRFTWSIKQGIIQRI